MKLYVKLNFQRLLLARLSKLHLRSSSLGTFWRFLFWKNAAEAGGKGESQRGKFTYCGEKLPIRSFYYRENYFSVFIFYWIDLCEICQKKLKSIFATAWHSCRNESQACWKVILLKLISLQILFSKNYKKFEMQRSAWILKTVEQKQKEVWLDLNWSLVCAEKSHTKNASSFGQNFGAL